MRPINEERLKSTLKYIQDYQIAEGKSPTYRQIQKDCKYSTINTVAKDIARLKDRGLIESDSSSGSNRIRIPFKYGASRTHNSLIVGSVHCGQPSPAIEDIEEVIPLPDSIFGSADHVILHAVGPSMIKRGIFDGDYLVVRRQITAEFGQIIIAMLEDGETTCKIFAKNEKGKPYLKAANDTLDSKGRRIYDIYPTSDWSIYGIVDYVIHEPLDEDM